MNLKICYIPLLKSLYDLFENRIFKSQILPAEDAKNVEIFWEQMKIDNYRTPHSKYLKTEFRDAIDSCEDGKCISEEFCQGVSNLINQNWDSSKPYDKITDDGKQLIQQACQYESWRIANFLQNDYETGCEHDFIPWHTKNTCTNEVCEIPYDGNNTIPTCPKLCIPALGRACSPPQSNHLNPTCSG